MSCTAYVFSLSDLFMPPYTIYDQLCSSKDKTGLFITSLTRLIIYWMISYYMENILINIWVVINVILLIIVIAKIPHAML